MKGTIENISIKNSSVKFSSEKYWMLIKEDSLFEQVTKLGKGKEVSYEFTWDALAKKRVLKSISPLSVSNTPTKEAKQTNQIDNFDKLMDALANPSNDLNFFLIQAKNSLVVSNNLSLIVSVKHTMASEKLARIMDDRS